MNFAWVSSPRSGTRKVNLRSKFTFVKDQLRNRQETGKDFRHAARYTYSRQSEPACAFTKR